MNLMRFGFVLAVAMAFTIPAETALGQSFGIELHNTMMPASGGMAGASLARPQDVQSAMRYVQGQFAAISQHRLTGGVGIRDVLPGLDLDLYAGGMFKNSGRYGHTIASLEGYWVGAGLTWRFGRGACPCQCQNVPNQW